MPLALIAAISFLSSALEPDRLSPQPLTSFDGKSWSGLPLGNLTDGDIKKQFKTEKGAIRPEALKIVTDKDSGVRVDALLDGRGDKATMRSIRVEYDNAIDLNKLSADLNEQPVPMFLSERYEDWYLATFVDHGIVGVVLNGRCDTFFLCGKDQLGTSLQDFSDRESRVSVPRDPGDGWDRIVRFGYTSATVSLGSNKPDDLDSDWRRRLGNRLRNQAEGFREPALRYTSSTDDRLTISVTSEKFNKDDEANFTVTLNLSAVTPYGRMEKSSSKSKKINSNYDRRISDLMEDTFYDLARDVRYAVQRLGPPPKEASRKNALDKFMDRATQKPGR